MSIVKKILYFLRPKDRKHAVSLFIMITIMAFLDMIGVASIVPFVAVLTNPDLIETNIILSTMFEKMNIFGIDTNRQFLFVLGFFVLILLIISLFFKALTTYAQVRFVQMRQYNISRRLVESYLHQPYSWFLNRHSADIGKNILSEVGQVVGNGIKPMVGLLAQGMVTIFLISLLIATDPKLALIVGFSLGSAYGLIYKFASGYLARIGKERLKNNELLFTAVVEAFGGAKEVKVSGLEQTYIKRYSDPAKILAQKESIYAAISQLPRFALEAIAFGGVLLLILYLMTQKGSFNDALPIISLYAFAGYRLMPALQEIYTSLTQLSFVGPSIDNLYNDVKSLQSFNLDNNKIILSFNEKIVLKNVNYNYPNASRTALRDINLTIPIKTTVGLVGATGSGKTTTVDVILGLLEPLKGSLEVDGKVITKQNSKAWQRSIGYVPQHIYLTDDTVAANIAFGVEPTEVNNDAVEKASRIANLHEFVINELPNQYQTTIGERGVRLSGGQRQRIGIARALYHNPKVLILDEATSALDNLTEKAVMDAVNNLSKNLTIILIAHRLSTVKKCDKIFLLEKGKLQNEGTFEELIKINNSFRINADNI